MPSSTGALPLRRSRTRRMGESAYGLLLLARNAAVALFALLIVAAGVWASWGTAQHAMLTKGRERGTLTVRSCGDEWCTGSFAPAGHSGEPRAAMRVDAAVADGAGDRLAVVVKPGTDQAVRTGAAGVLHAWVPFGGSLLLAAVVLAGGLRMRRTGWGMAVAGGALLVASFATL
ncbi:hypothetical protein [Streptomyces sp. XD-27]|uniref:hypothetical protein n=1 Tax=Streptomyces sp. XD-27 TaxID=3062779 RepID=UPI0026F4756E|nr:hypothetical protein [Streptomyces sp. XD-27]WKX72247.1 hypothetical protein Q3Y56_22185 [Streptomyces sp. XD-27]